MRSLVVTVAVVRLCRIRALEADWRRNSGKPAVPELGPG